jgi:ABC-2 type transport system permease protein
LASLPTAILSDGDSAALPQRFEARSGNRFSPFYRTTGTHVLGAFFPETPTANPAASLAGSFDLAFVATYLYPLLILALTCNIANADRESGVLALIRSQPVSLVRWLAARALVRAAFLFCVAVLLPALAVSAMVAGSWVRLAIWILALTAYLAFWFAVAVVVSLRTSSPAPGFVIGISTWLAFVILVPALVNLAAPLLAPASATISYVNAERAASLEINSRIDAASTAVIRYGTVPHELLMPLIDRQPRWRGALSRTQLQHALGETRRLMFEQRLAPVLEQLNSDERTLERAISILSFCSPALLFESVADDLAGTGRPRWRNFVAQVDAHVRAHDEQVTKAILAGQPAPPALPFRFREESGSGLLRRIAARLVALLLLPWLAAASGRLLPLMRNTSG